MRGEQLEAARSQRHALEPLEVAVDVVGDAPPGQSGRERGDLVRARGDMQVHLRRQRAMGVRNVDGIVERVPGHGLAVGVDRHAAAAVVADEADEGRSIAHPLHEGLVHLAARERLGRGGRAGGVLGRLDQEAVAVAEVRELVDKPRVRRAPPRAPVLEVAAGGGCAGMESQILPHRRSADPRAQQQRRRLERPAGHDDARRAHRDARAAPRPRVRVDRLDGGGAAALDEDALGEAAHDHLGARSDRVGEVGLGG